MKHRISIERVRALREAFDAQARGRISFMRLVECVREWDAGAASFDLPQSVPERVMAIVKKAGAAGILAPDVAAQLPDTPLRYVHVSLCRLRERGRVESRSPTRPVRYFATGST